MKHLKVRLKYSAARRIFNSLLSVSSSDETLRLMLDILLLTGPVNDSLVQKTVTLFSFSNYSIYKYKMIARAIMAPANSR